MTYGTSYTRLERVDRRGSKGSAMHTHYGRWLAIAIDTALDYLGRPDDHLCHGGQRRIHPLLVRAGFSSAKSRHDLASGKRWARMAGVDCHPRRQSDCFRLLCVAAHNSLRLLLCNTDVSRQTSGCHCPSRRVACRPRQRTTVLITQLPKGEMHHPLVSARAVPSSCARPGSVTPCLYLAWVMTRAGASIAV